MKKLPVIIILTIGFLLRLYRINEPIADWHSHRQADTAAVTQIYNDEGFDFFHPRYFDISSTQSGVENPHGYRMVEAPIYNAISLFFGKIFGLNITLASRLVSILFSLGSGWLIYLIVVSLTSLPLAGLFSLAVFMFFPFNVYYSRVVLPEPSAAFFMLLSFYLFQKNLLLSGVALGISLLIKPYTGLIISPVYALLILAQPTKYLSKKNILFLSLFSIITLAPFGLWRLWISQFPEGIPSSNWLLNNGVTTTFPAWYHGYNLSFLNKLIAFRPHWWYWLFQERLGILILGIFGTIPLFLGLAFNKKHTQSVTLGLLLGILVYFVVIAQGNIQHDYYQTLIVPSLSIIVGIGYFYISQFLFNSIFAKSLAILTIFVLSTYFSLDQVKNYYKINNQNIVTSAQKARELLPTDSLIIAPNNGDTTLLFQTGHFGWPVEIYDIDSKINMYSPRPIYLLSLNYDKYTNDLMSKYPTVIKEPSYIILKLSP
jgi:4-amino-4-deoxy-L-arabinose transferase-like glycosyltransferase